MTDVRLKRMVELVRFVRDERDDAHVVAKYVLNELDKRDPLRQMQQIEEHAASSEYQKMMELRRKSCPHLVVSIDPSGSNDPNIQRADCGYCDADLVHTREPGKPWGPWEIERMS